jgi:hypothetical protein
MTTKTEKWETVVLPGGQRVAFRRGAGRRESVTTRVFHSAGRRESVTTRVLRDTAVETAALPPAKVSPAE